MKRHNQILAGILVIQIILAIVVLWPRSTVTGANEPLFPDLGEGGDIVALTITDADDNSIQLKKVDGDWALPNADDYPAQVDKITPLLDKIVGLTTSRLVTRTDASHKRLQVSPDDFLLRFDFETEDRVKHTLYLGSSPRYSSTHFRVEGQSETYLTSELSVWEAKAEAASWIDTTYLSVPEDDITKLTLENANGTFTFTKDDEGTWTLGGLAADETLDEAKVTSLIQRAATVNMIQPLGKEEQAAYGMDEPNALVMVETGDKTITLRVGAKEPDANRYTVISSESPYYVGVYEYSVKDFVEKTRDDFLQLPPTPTSEATSAP